MLPDRKSWVALSGLCQRGVHEPQGVALGYDRVPLWGVGVSMRSTTRDMCLTWIANAFRPEGAPTNQPQASPGEQAIIKPPSTERAAQRDECGTSLRLRRAWSSVGALTTPFTKLQGVPPTRLHGHLSGALVFRSGQPVEFHSYLQGQKSLRAPATLCQKQGPPQKHDMD